MSETTVKINGAMIPCGNSLFHANLLTSYQVHLAPAKEIEKYHGVCQKCFRKFQSKNAGILNGAIERPVEILTKHHAPDPELDHRGISTSGEIEQTIDFDFSAVDEGLAADAQEFFDQASEDVRSTAATALGMILEWCWQNGFVTAQRKFAVITAGLRPELLSDESWEQIGARLGCTKASISKLAVHFQKQFRIKFHRSRSESARQHMAESMRGNTNRRKSAPTPPAAT